MKRIVSPIPALLLCAFLALFLAACGQRGPLYLPEPGAQAESTAAADKDSKEETEENSEEND